MENVYGNVEICWDSFWMSCLTFFAYNTQQRLLRLVRRNLYAKTSQEK